MATNWAEDGVSIVDLYYSHTLILLIAIIIGCIIYLVGGALQTGAQNLNYLWAGRWIAGLGVGFLVMIVPIYQYVFPCWITTTKYLNYHCSAIAPGASTKDAHY